MRRDARRRLLVPASSGRHGRAPTRPPAIAASLRPDCCCSAAREHRLDLARSWFIGDILDDVEAGNRAGCRTILLDNGHETEWIEGDRSVSRARALLISYEAAQIVVRSVEAVSRPAPCRRGNRSMNVAASIAQPTTRALAARPTVRSSAHWGEDIKLILCVRLDNLGDVLMTTPALHALRESGPGRHITLLGSRSGAALAPYLDDVDDVIEYEAPWVANPAASSRSLADDQRMQEALAARRL